MRYANSLLNVLAAGLWLVAPLAAAQPAAPAPHNVVQLSATAAVEARQDLLSVTLRTSRDGSEPLLVQEQLKAALEAGLAEARSTAQPGAMEVRSGNFSLVPRQGRDGRISGWQGTAEMVLSGRDFERIASTAGRIQGLTVAGVVFGLSREQRERLETQAQAQGIERFRARAGEVARAFGFTTYTLREVNVSSQELGTPPRPRFMTMEVRSSATEAPLPLEAGQATVQVTVSGSVQLK
jgi:predicted secreted protein